MKFLAAPVGFFGGDADLIRAPARRFEGVLLRRTNILLEPRQAALSGWLVNRNGRS